MLCILRLGFIMLWECVVSFAFVSGIKKRCQWQLPTEQIFTRLISTFCRQMPPDIQLSWIKKIIEQNKRSSFEIKCRIAKLVTVQWVMFRMSKNQVGSDQFSYSIWTSSTHVSYGEPWLTIYTCQLSRLSLTPAGWKLRSHAGLRLRANFSRLIEKCELLLSCLTQFPKIILLIQTHLRNENYV